MKYPRQFNIGSTTDHVQVTGHEAPAMNEKTFLSLAIS